MPPKDWVEQPGNVIRFPPRFRVVPNVTPATEGLITVEHDGQAYPAAVLLRLLTLNELRQIDAMKSCSAQDLWDEAVRRWPALTAEIVAGARRAKLDYLSPAD